MLSWSVIIRLFLAGSSIIRVQDILQPGLLSWWPEPKIPDQELAIETGVRVDLPPALRDKLLRSATEIVRHRLLSRAPAHLFEELRTAIEAVAAGVSRDMTKVYDFTNAKSLVSLLESRGELNEKNLRNFAVQRKYEETVVALARLSQSSIEVIRPLMQGLRDDGVLVSCRAAELDWETVSAVLQCRFVTGAMSPIKSTHARRRYMNITVEKARQLLRFWQVRIITRLIDR